MVNNTKLFLLLTLLGMSTAMPYIDTDFNDLEHDGHKPTTTTTTTTTTAAPLFPQQLPGRPFAALGAALAPALGQLVRPVISGLATGVGNAIKNKATTTTTTPAPTTTTKPPKHPYPSYLDAFLIHIPGSSANLVLVSTDSAHESAKLESTSELETKLNFRGPSTIDSEESESEKNVNVDI